MYWIEGGTEGQRDRGTSLSSPSSVLPLTLAAVSELGKPVFFSSLRSGLIAHMPVTSDFKTNFVLLLLTCFHQICLRVH